MAQTTYDPVLKVEEIAQLRLFRPLRPPVPGQALVLVPHEGPATAVWPGDTIPSPRIGAWQSAFTLDVADHRLVLELPLLSRDATFAFQSSLALTCRVTNPVAVAARGIRDMSAALADPLRRMLRRVSRYYDISEFHEAEEALNEAVDGLAGDDAIELSSLQVELLVDADEVASSGRSFRDVARETRLAAMRRQRHLDMLRADGVEGLIAEILEHEGAAAAWNYIEKAEEAERAELRTTLEMILKRGDKDREPFETAEAERAVLGRVLGGSAAPFGGMRGSRVHGSALPLGKEERVAPSSPRAVRRDTPPYEPYQDAPAPSGSGFAAEDADGAVTAGPPEDEPLGPTESARTAPFSRRYDPRPQAASTPENAPADGAAPPPRTSRVRGVHSPDRPGDAR